MSLLHQKGGEIYAHKIIDAINSGYDIDLFQVKITGDLILSLAEAAKYENGSKTSEISFEEPRRITSHLRFHLCSFEGIVDFANTIFCREVSFANSYFKADTTFWSKSGGNPLKSTEFMKPVDFSNAIFYKNSDFNSVIFRDDAIFQETSFMEDKTPRADFGNTKFYGETNFTASNFYREVSFLNARFHGLAEFSSSTTFKKKAIFSDAIFYEIVRFYGCHFEDDLVFSNANFDRDTILTHSIFKKGLILKGTRFKVMKMDNVQFENDSNISLEGSFFDRLVVDWDTIKAHLNKEGNDDASYLSLIKNFKDLGRRDDADSCLIQYKTQFKK